MKAEIRRILFSLPNKGIAKTYLMMSLDYLDSKTYAEHYLSLAMGELRKDGLREQEQLIGDFIHNHYGA